MKIILKADNNEFPGFRGKNNEDTLVTSLRLVRQMYSELTDRFPGNTDKVTHSLSWMSVKRQGYTHQHLGRLPIETQRRLSF